MSNLLTKNPTKAKCSQPDIIEMFGEIVKKIDVITGMNK